MEPTPTSNRVLSNAFIQRHQANVSGVLQGWDRLRLQATLRSLYKPSVMEYYLQAAGVLWKDFKAFATSLTERVRAAADALAQEHARPVIYLPSSSTRKEEQARFLAQRDGVKTGLVGIFSCVEPCRTWFARGNRQTRRLEMKLQWGKCIHLYFYWVHEELGWLHLRLQTWFPFLAQVCVNGREWLARQMDVAGLSYQRVDNAFTSVSDVERAQALLEAQHRVNWPRLMNPLLKTCHPLHAEIARPIGADYYWTLAESEYATDVMFRDRAALARIYPGLVHHAMMSFGSEQVLRFLGRSGRAGIHDEVKTDRRRGEDGVRVKHWLNRNSLKFYDKGSVLRVEATINEPKDFKVWRAAEKKRSSEKKWRILRRGVADVKRRAEVSRAATERHLSALATANGQVSLGQETSKVCRTVVRAGRRHRALHPFGQDAELLRIVNRGAWSLNGFRNRDLRDGLYNPTTDPLMRRRQAAAVGRKLRLLRAHGLIKRVSNTHRYTLTERGRRIVTALLAAESASVEQLTKLAA